MSFVSVKQMRGYHGNRLELGEEAISEDEASAQNPDVAKSIIGKSHSQRIVQNILKPGLGSDVEFKFSRSSSVIRGNKFILSAHSIFFAQLFARTDYDVDFVEINDASAEEFELFLEHLYTGAGAESIGDAFLLLKLAAKYKVPDMEAQCTEFLKNNFTDVTAIEILEMESGNDDLKRDAVDYVCRHAYRILGSSKILELSSENFKRLLGSDNLASISELQVYDAGRRWGQAEIRRQGMPRTEKYLRAVLEDVVPLIRFPLMQKNEFYVKVIHDELRILTSEEKEEMSYYFKVAQPDRDKIKLRIFETKARRSPVLLKGARKAYLLDRLKPTPATSATSHALPSSKEPMSFRITQGAPIWVTSIGFCLLQTRSGTYEIKNCDTQATVASNLDILLERGSRGTQIMFRNGLLLTPGLWYSISFNPTGNCLCASLDRQFQKWKRQFFQSAGNSVVVPIPPTHVTVPTNDGFDIEFEFDGCGCPVEQCITTIGFQLG